MKDQKCEEKIEQEISDQIIIWIKSKPKVSQAKIKNKIIQEITKRDYLKEDWQIHYATERIIIFVKKKQKNQELLIWKKYFSGWNFVINCLIALIPASIVIGILREMGLGGALIIGSILFGFIYLAGFVREKISSKIRQLLLLVQCL